MNFRSIFLVGGLFLMLLPAVALSGPAGRDPPTAVYIAELIRHGPRKDDRGSSIPPFDRAEVELPLVKEHPKGGSEATVVPLRAGLSPLVAVISGAESGSGLLKEERLWRWTFQPIVRTDILVAAPSRFQVVVLYPAVPLARALEVSKLSPTDLPRGVTMPDVKFAIDWTGDIVPEILITDVCCGSDPDPCDFACRTIYRRQGARWVVIDRKRRNAD